MWRALRLTVVALVMMASGVAGQVTLSVSPSTVEDGVATDVTISLGDASGEGFSFGAVSLTLSGGDGLQLSGFEWLVAEFESDVWFLTTDLPTPEAVAFGGGVTVGADETLELARINVVASGLDGVDLVDMVIVSDASDLTPIMVQEGGLTILVTVSSGMDDGSDGVGSGGGDVGGGGTGDVGSVVDPVGPADDPASDGDGMDGGGGDESPGAGDGMDDSMGTGGDVTIDDMDLPTGGEDGGGVDGDGVGDGSGGVEDSGVDGDGGADNSGGDAGGEDPPSGGSMPLCGLGMMTGALFTLGGLSVMTAFRRRL
jgi:hypothetical protein